MVSPEGSSFQLGVGAEKTFTAQALNGTAPYNYTWTIAPTGTFNLSINGETVLLQNTTILKVTSENLTLMFPYAVENEFIQVYASVTDVDGLEGKSELILIADPYTSPGYKFDASTADFTYKVDTDGKGWYHAVEGATGAVKFSSTNSTYVLQSVITAIGGNGSIYITRGIYPIQGLNIKNTFAVTDQTQQHIEIYGDGFGNTILRGITSSVGASSIDGSFTQKAWLMVDSFDNQGVRVYLHDFQIDGQHDSQTNIVSGIVLRYGRDAIIERVFVQRCSRNGIDIVGPNLAFRAITVQDCQVYDINDPDGIPEANRLLNCVGINMENGVADVFIKNNYIGWIGWVNDETDSLGTGIGISDSCQAIGNTVWAAACGIESWPDTRDQIIEGNLLDFTYSAAILLVSTNNTNINANSIRFPYDYGIYLANSFYNSIQDNKFMLRPTYSSISFIAEQGTSDYNSIINNNCQTDGIITWEIIHTVGANTVVAENAGYKLTGSVLSSAFPIDAAEVVTVSIPHGLYRTPSLTNCQLTVVQDTNVDDWCYGFVKLVSVDTTNVYVKINVTNASATVGATAKLALTVSP